MESSGNSTTHNIRFWPIDKTILSIPLAKHGVNRIEGNLLFFQENFGGLSMCLVEPITQTQDDVMKLTDYQRRIASDMG